jgi:hypothetical protein
VKGLPFRWRTSSINQRARPTPTWSSGVDGTHPIRQRVIVEDGWIGGQRSRDRWRRASKMGVCPSDAASWSRLVAV